MKPPISYGKNPITKLAVLWLYRKWHKVDFLLEGLCYWEEFKYKLNISDNLTVTLHIVYDPCKDCFGIDLDDVRMLDETT